MCEYSIKPLLSATCDVSTLVPHVKLENDTHNAMKKHSVRMLNPKAYNNVLYAKNNGSVVGAIVWRRRDNHKLCMVARNGKLVPFAVDVPQTKRTPSSFIEGVFGKGAILVKYVGRDGGSMVGGPTFNSGSVAGNKWLI